ncbi:unnamed protein product [Anisakis simplex]|uniref:Uncharacterized protein n=1 Tax=Anisakis simplex TaxID=6269 RepID=A0A3P6PZF4_ANISI|nr:unnamed protein product [Anisakis simplex]
MHSLTFQQTTFQNGTFQEQSSSFTGAGGTFRSSVKESVWGDLPPGSSMHETVQESVWGDPDMAALFGPGSSVHETEQESFWGDDDFASFLGPSKSMRATVKESVWEEPMAVDSNSAANAPAAPFPSPPLFCTLNN